MINRASGLFIKLTALFAASLMLLSFVDMTVPKNESAVYDSIIRLHILANSDSDHDQHIKLAVRDRIIAQCKMQGECDTRHLARDMTDIANSVLAEYGVDYTAHAVFGKERYPTREYDGISFPSGEYASLRIILGDGEGHNWWCVLFPPLCLSAATAKEELGGVGIDSDSYKVYTKQRYIIRFRFLEWFN